MGEGEAVNMELPNERAGEKLCRAREAAGLTLKDVSASTRITERHLQMIEDGAWGDLPGRPYAIGFAKNYARAIGLDGDAVAEEVRDELNRDAYRTPRRPAYQMELEDPAKVPSRRLTVWAALLLVVGLVGVGLFLGRGYFRPAAELPPLSESDDPLADVGAAAPSPTAESAAPTAAASDDADATGAATASPAPAAAAGPATVNAPKAPGPAPRSPVPAPVTGTTSAPAAAGGAARPAG